MANAKHFSTTELAKILGISRVGVFYKIKKGDISATKVGRNYVIDSSELSCLSGSKLSIKDKRGVAYVVKRAARQYRKTLELLGKE